MGTPFTGIEFCGNAILATALPAAIRNREQAAEAILSDWAAEDGRPLKDAQ